MMKNYHDIYLKCEQLYTSLVNGELNPKDASDMIRQDSNIREYIESIGVKFDDLSNKVYERSLANCIYLKKWADNYKFTGQSYNKRSLF